MEQFELYIRGRICNNCNATDVATDWMGDCADCQELWKQHEQESGTYQVPINPQIGDVIPFVPEKES